MMNMTNNEENKMHKSFADIMQQSTYCKKKCNNQPSIKTHLNIPEDIFNEINNISLRSPKTLAPPKKIVFTEDSIYNIKNKYTMPMFELEEKLFVFPKEVINMVKTSFELSCVSEECQKRVCFLCNKYVSNNPQKFYDHIRSVEHVSHFKKTTQDQECFILAKQFMQKISDNYIKCYGCKIHFTNTRKASKKHANKQTHKQIFEMLHKHSNYQCSSLLKEFENCWYNIQMYACILCNKIFQFKFNFLQHLNNVHKNEQDITYDFCMPCAMVWVVYKDKIAYSYSIHCDLVMHKYLVNSSDFMVKEMPKHVKDILNDAEETSEKLYELSEIIFQNDIMQQKLLKSLKSAMSPQFPTMKLHPFGSRLTGLGFSNSDLDIFLDCKGDLYEETIMSSLMDEYLDVTKNLLCKDKNNWIVQETLKKTRIPIIKLRHRLTGLQCDISFANGLSVENTKLIRSFNKACQPCRKLILFVKKWLSFCSLPGRSGVRNYALAWFVIFYLQNNEGLPSIDTLIKQKNVSRLISGWETGVDFEIPILSIEKSFIRLLMGFFDFYGDFDYKNYVACPLVGDVVKKQDFINHSNLPTAMSPYIKYLKQSCNAEIFRIDSSMCLQDPFDLSHNLTKAVQPLTLKAFKKYCKDSADIIRSILHHQHINKDF